MVELLAPGLGAAPHASLVVQAACILLWASDRLGNILPSADRVEKNARAVRTKLRDRKVSVAEEFIQQALEVDSARRTDSFFSESLSEICERFVAAWDENTELEFAVAGAHAAFDRWEPWLKLPPFGAALLFILTWLFPAASIVWVLVGGAMLLCELGLLVRVFLWGQVILKESKGARYVRKPDV